MTQPRSTRAPLLAVASVARLRHGLRDPRMSELLEGVERINRLADQTAGFVWRCRGEVGHSALLTTSDRADVLVNVSLWRDYASFHRFTYHGLHGRYLTARERWFVSVPGPTTVLWWVSADARPGVDVAMARLAVLRREGPSPRAFTVLRRWSADGAPEPTRRRRPRFS